jgi:uncharacterized protein
MKIRKTPYYSYTTGTIPKGCQLCVKGRKTVIFITGICPKSCFYCPISEQKYKKDVVYINEWPTKKSADMLKEIRLCSSKGAGITGGDPLARLSRTLGCIRLLKKTFGKGFHIHIYTPLDLVNEKTLKSLYIAGLDEIRFHPDINKKHEWHRLSLPKAYPWKVGIEIPIIPGTKEQVKELIRYAADKIDFLNLNELEISDTNAQHLLERGFRPKDRLSYGVNGSEELAKRLLKYCQKLGISTHYCTSKLKDKVQLANRLKLRAKNAKQPYDFVTDEGMLARGAVYPEHTKLSLTALKNRIIKEFRLPKNRVFADKARKRLLVPAEFAHQKAKLLNKYGRVAIVEEYPTFDCLNVQTIFL